MTRGMILLIYVIAHCIRFILGKSEASTACEGAPGMKSLHFIPSHHFFFFYILDATLSDLFIQVYYSYWVMVTPLKLGRLCSITLFHR